MLPWSAVKITLALSLVSEDNNTDRTGLFNYHLYKPLVTANNAKMRESLLRSENPNSVYCGNAQGKGISERFSVVVPLNMSRSVTRSGLTRQTLAFKFVCQNSCIGRKETSLVFCLEKAW